MCKTICFDLCLLLVLLLLGEAYLRTDARFKYLRVSDDESLGYPKAINSLGLRGREYSPQELAGASPRKVMVAGDSVAFGSGVAWDKTFSAQLEQILTPDFVVLNAGAQGDTIEKALKTLLNRYSTIKAHTIIFTFSPSMVADGLNPAGTTSKQKNSSRSFLRQISPVRIHNALYTNLRVYAFFQREIRVLLYRLGLMVENTGKQYGALLAYAFKDPALSDNVFHKIQATYDRIGADLRRLNATLSDKGVRLLVVGVPSRFMISDLSMDNLRSVPKSKIRIDPMNQLAEEIRGVPFLDTTPALAEVRRKMVTGDLDFDPLYIKDDYAHLNEHGHAIVAKAIHNRFFRAERNPKSQTESNLKDENTHIK